MTGTVVSQPVPGRVADITAKLREEYGRNCQQDAPTQWRFEVPTVEDRSHVVTLLVREMWHAERDLSRFVAFAPIGPATASLSWQTLLRMNSAIDVGAVAIDDVWIQDVRRPFVVFRASHLVATADYPEIWELIRKTAEYADHIERAVYSRDIY